MAICGFELIPSFMGDELANYLVIEMDSRNWDFERVLKIYIYIYEVIERFLLQY